jgi:hypothetical protein
MWKCHKETPHVAILNKQKSLFFFFNKIGEQEGGTQVLPWGRGIGSSGRGWRWGKGIGGCL